MNLPPPMESLWTNDRLELQFWVDQLRDQSTAMLLLVLAAGIIFLLYGRTIFRAIVMINTALLAGYVGWRFGQQIEMHRPWLLGVISGGIVGLMSWPLFKLGVAVLCGLAGAALAAQLAPLLPRGDQFASLYSLAGFIVFAVAGTFLLLFAITVFTAMEGSTMIIMSTLILAERTHVLAKGASWVTLKEPGAIHIAIGVLGMLGLVYQLSRGTKATALPASQAPPASSE